MVMGLRSRLNWEEEIEIKREKKEEVPREARDALSLEPDSEVL